MEVRFKIFALLMLVATVAEAQGVTDTCDYFEGGVLERQMQTGITGLLRGSGYCIQRTTVNGGLEMVGATLSVVDGDTTGQVLRWNGTDWVPRLIIFPAAAGQKVDTAYNGLTKVPYPSRAVKMGGPLVENTTVTGQQTYDFFLNNMRYVEIEAERTGGVAYSTVTLGSTALQGADLFHVNSSSGQVQSQLKINYSTGNTLKVQDAYDNGAYFQQYDVGGGYFQTDIRVSNAASSQTITLNRDAMYFSYPAQADEVNEAAFLMIDTLTDQVLRKSPADFTWLYGDDWGGQVVEKTARFSGGGTTGSPLDLAQQSATSGQVLKWSGTAWAPGTDAGASPANLTAASSRVAITGGTGAVLSAATVDVTEANLNIGSLGGTLDVAKIVNGASGSFLRSGAGAPAWQTAASLQGDLLLPNGTNGQTIRHNGTAWTANSLLHNDGSYIGIGTTSPASILDIRRPGNDAFLNLTGYDAKIKVGGTLGGNQTYSAQFLLESENAGIREIITEIVPTARSTALYRYYGAEVTNTFSGTDGVVRCQSGVNPFFQRMWAAGGRFDIGIIDKQDGQTFSSSNLLDKFTIRASGRVGIGDVNPAQTLHVQGTARITGSDGTATTIMGRDADGDISNVGIGAGLALSGGTVQADIINGLNISGNDIAWGGALTENTTVDFETYDVFFTDMPSSTTEDEALVIDSGTGKLARGQIPYTALRNPGEATYLGANGSTGETVTWQPEDILVEADPTAGKLTIELNTSMKQGLAYSLFGCCNLSYNIILNNGTMKVSGAYSTASSYTLGAGEHLEVIRLSSSTFYVSKK